MRITAVDRPQSRDLPAQLQSGTSALRAAELDKLQGRVRAGESEHHPHSRESDARRECLPLRSL